MQGVFNKRLLECLRKGIPVNPEAPEKVFNAYTLMHQVLDECYLPKPAISTISTVRKSRAWKKGYELIDSADFSIMADRLKSFIEDNVKSDETQESIDTDIAKALISRAIKDIEAATGGTYIVWRIYPYITNDKTDSYSTKWHYDVHVQQDMPYSMYFIGNDSEGCGGTNFVSADKSREISDSTGYISSPLNTRVSDLETIGYTAKDADVKFIDAGKDCGAIFWPSRVLHRGRLPHTGKQRYAIHFSFLAVANNSTIEDRIENSMQISQLQLGEDSSAIPYYDSDPSPQDSLVIWDGKINSQYSRQCIEQAIFPNGSNLNKQASWKASDVNAYIDELKDLALTSNDMPTINLLKEYVQSVNEDLLRYTLHAKSHTFWPNPEHPKYPASIVDTKPFVDRIPLISKDTPLSSAGSCFAVEISEHFQANGYNYLITEKPESSDDGVQVDGYFPGESDYVRFSANYGIHFNSLSIMQLAQRAFNEVSFKKILIQYNGHLLDPYRELVLFRSPEDYLADYDRHTNAVKDLFERVKVFIFTMGLNECWRFRDDGSALSRNPYSPHLYPLIKHSILTVEEHVNAIESFFAIVKKRNPDFKLILSLSPIAFLATGRAATQHVVNANSHSKSVQRVAAEILANKHQDIYYFPSYEYVTFCLKSPWKPDGRHLTKDSIKKVMDFFEDMFVEIR